MHEQPHCKSKVEDLERQETELFKAHETLNNCYST